MVKCSVELHYSAYLVSFDDGKTLLIQGDSDQQSFLESCGVEDYQDVEECPEEYYDMAE